MADGWLETYSWIRSYIQTHCTVYVCTLEMNLAVGGRNARIAIILILLIRTDGLDEWLGEPKYHILYLLVAVGLCEIKYRNKIKALQDVGSREVFTCANSTRIDAVSQSTAVGFQLPLSSTLSIKDLDVRVGVFVLTSPRASLGFRQATPRVLHSQPILLSQIKSRHPRRASNSPWPTCHQDKSTLLRHFVTLEEMDARHDCVLTLC